MSDQPTAPASVPRPHQALTRPLPDLAAWTSHLRGMEIPVLASTAEQLEIWRANEDAADAHLLGEILNKDPLMTLKLLAHAASQRSSRLLTDAETVTAALVLLGITPFFKAFGPQPTVEDRLADRPDAMAGLQRVLHRAERAARFALGFAAHRADPDAEVIHSAALLHDFSEMLMWCEAPDLALEVLHRQQADSTLRSVAVQREVLHVELGDLEQTLMKAWRLPELLTHITDDKKGNDPQVRCVTLAVRLARHTSERWENPAVPDDLVEIGSLLNLSPAHTLKLVHELDGVI
ncbi:HDOD domain-containing protein [Roseateles amylovorans]|uniref:HDOD domain-containing protein n=1 Tax=Roseateles amylovorans TaxID=2978473 RepID=A0ABY6AXL6_9BURK|nr:HDOD domain-containing protein [Roseateles amylovorans]UXH77921.1 HDOD domain-containing protein [Roseateles amylovorans]